MKPISATFLAAVLLTVSIPTSITAQTRSHRPPVSSLRVPHKVTFCGEEVPLERPDIKERLEREFYYFLDKEGQLVLYLKRVARCDPVVEPILREEGLPPDLKFVPVAESGLVFRAHSSAGASGYWQFQKGTAKQYGLKVDRHVDERRDLAKSTRAAAKYLKVLHARFGSWETALAAYNWGKKRVAQAIDRQGTDNYYDLYLPEETDRFVFQIILFKIILENPQAYHIHVPPSELYRAPVTEEVVVKSKRSLPMGILASSAGVGSRSLRFLNPWMISDYLPGGKYIITVPRGQGPGYFNRVSQGLGKSNEIIHIVKQDENLSLIAEKYGTTTRQIERWNNISRKRPIYPGQRLILFKND